MSRNPPPPGDNSMSFTGLFYRPREDGQNGKNGKNDRGPPPGSVIMEEVQTPVMRSGQPIAMVCPYCKKQMETEVTYESGIGAWLVAGLICLAGCCCFAWIPLVTDVMKDAVHQCSECHREMGRYIRLQPHPPPRRRARRSTQRRPAREQQAPARESSQKSASSWRTGSRSSEQQSPRKESKTSDSFFSWGGDSNTTNRSRKESKSSDSFFSWGDKGRSQSERRGTDQKRDLTDRERGQHTQKHRSSFSLW